MINKMYVIYDAKAEYYNKPYYAVNHEVAMRNAKRLCEDPNSEIAHNPEDFTLFYIGEFDDGTCTFDLEDVMVPIIKFHEIAGGDHNG